MVRPFLAALAFLAFAPPALALPPCDVALDADERARVERGEIIVRLEATGKATMRDVISVGYVDAAVPAVWRVITDYAHYKEIFPSILVCETRFKKGNVVHNYSELDYPWPLPDQWTLNKLTHDEPNHRLAFRRLDGSVKEVDGRWHLIADGKRTLIVYQVRVDPGLPLVPAWAIEWGSSRVAPAIIEGVRKRLGV